MKPTILLLLTLLLSSSCCLINKTPENTNSSAEFGNRTTSSSKKDPAYTYKASANLSGTEFSFDSSKDPFMTCGKSTSDGKTTLITQVGAATKHSVGVRIQNYSAPGNYNIDSSRSAKDTGGKASVSIGGVSYVSLNHNAKTDSNCSVKTQESDGFITINLNCRNLYSGSNSIAPKDLTAEFYCKLK